jgi:RNA-directed DNA polymerase
VRGNQGARTAGVDRLAPREVIGPAVAELLAEIREDLKSGGFVPQRVREKAIPKAPGNVSGKVRRLGIPTTRDRVVQAAVKLVLGPIFEADFKPCSYGPTSRRASTRSTTRP